MKMEALQNLENFTQGLNGIKVHIRTTRPDLFVAVVDVDYGVGIVKPGEPENVLNLNLEEIRNLTFKDLVKNKEHLLNLKPKSGFGI